MEKAYFIQISIEKKKYDKMTHEEFSKLEKKVGAKAFKGDDLFAVSMCGGIETGELPLSPMHTWEAGIDYIILSFCVTDEASKKGITSGGELLEHFSKKLSSAKKKGIYVAQGSCVTMTDVPIGYPLIKMDHDKTKQMLRDYGQGDPKIISIGAT